MQSGKKDTIELRQLKKLAHYFQTTGLTERAEAFHRKIIEIDPSNANAYSDLAILTLKQGLVDDSHYFIQKGLENNPQSPVLHNILGIYFREQEMYGEAMQSFRKAISLASDFVAAKYNLVHLLLAMGQHEKGFQKLAELDLKFLESRVLSKLPLWKGKRFFQKKLLIYANCSIADTLLFIRYLPLVKARGGTVILAVKKPLLEILSSVDGVDNIIDVDQLRENVYRYNLFVSLLSLPAIFTKTEAEIPTKLPYILAPEALTAYWKYKLGSGDFLNVGFAFSRIKHELPILSLFAREKAIATSPGFVFHNLGKGCKTKDLRIVDWSTKIKGLDHLAAVIDNMDIIITTDNTIATLAGSMNKQVWFIFPFCAAWYWSRHQLVSPWYPTVKLCHSPHSRDWSNAVAKIHEDLHQKASLQSPIALNSKSQIASLLHNARQSQLSGDISQAECIYHKIVSMNPQDVNALQGLGLILMQKGDYHTAIEWLQKAMTEKPNVTSIRNNLAIALEKQDRTKEAAEQYKQALDLGANAEVCNNYANLLLNTGEIEGAVEYYRKALDINPTYTKAFLNFGGALERQGNYQAAMDCFRKAIEIDSENKIARKALSRLLLLLGNYEEGFKDYDIDSRDVVLCNKIAPLEKAKPWLGKNFYGQRLLLFCTGELQDTLQFARYIPMVKKRGGKVIVLVPKSLSKLMFRFPGVDQVIEIHKQPQPKGEWFISIQALPFIFRTSLSTIPDQTSLSADSRLMGKKKKDDPSILHIGIALLPHESNNRGISSSEFMNIIVRLEMQSSIRLHYFSDHDLSDLAHATACMTSLDLVIANDNEIAHLSALLGRRTWIVLDSVPDWRWLLEQKDSPWYTTVQIFRREKNQPWGEICDQIHALIHTIYCVENIQ